MTVFASATLMATLPMEPDPEIQSQATEYVRVLFRERKVAQDGFSPAHAGVMEHLLNDASTLP